MTAPPFVVGPDAYRRQDARTDRGLRALTALNRINALTCIRAARHGWLGASWSAAELLTVLYFGLDGGHVILGKGHAAAMQYACLAGIGLLPVEALLSYKDGPDAPQAHSSIGTPGILTNTGSLGQALSKAAGLAWARPDERFFVVLGDGELQEGQVFEGLQTVAWRRPKNLVVVIDRNGFQTERRTDTIKPIHDLAGVLRGLGLEPLEVDGHDPAALRAALTTSTDRPLVLIADTIKAGGSTLLAPQDGVQPWHGKVPDDALYRTLLTEQVARTGDPELTHDFEDWQRSTPLEVPAPPRRPAPSTRDAFAAELECLLDEHPHLVALDADLAGSCGLARIADPDGRFVGRGQLLQMGIAEQDMTSFAGGLALAGLLPVINTYAAFHKRALEQLQVNLSEGSRFLVAGHYAGLCYFTDGRTHQSLNDLLLMRSLPGLLLLEPVTAAQTRRLLRHAVLDCDRSVYLRLRRTPAEIPITDTGPFDADDPLSPLVHGEGRHGWFVTAGTVATRLALDCLAEPDFAGWGLVVQSAFGHDVDPHPWRELIGSTPLLSIEESPRPGVLRPFLQDVLPGVELRSLCVEGWGASFRTLDACREHFGFTVGAVRELLRS